jgi:predicted lipoprotein with Yx(FWY)xxD motif
MFSAAGIVGVAIVLAACGSSAKKASTASPPTSAASSSTTSTAAPSSNSGTISTASSSKGEILVDAKGKSLYVFDKDTSGTIACTTGCVAIWPPLVVPNGTSAPTGVMNVTATLGTVMRPDGTTQLTSDGRPLYTFSGDSAAGQVNGDGFAGGIWHVAKASGNGSAPAAGGASGTTTPSSSSSSSGGYGY